MKITSNSQHPFQPDRKMLSNSEGVSEAIEMSFPPSSSLYANAPFDRDVEKSNNPKVAKVAHQTFAHFNRTFGRSRS